MHCSFKRSIEQKLLTPALWILCFSDIMTDVYHVVQHGQHHAWLSPISNLLASPKIKNKTEKKQNIVNSLCSCYICFLLNMLLSCPVIAFQTYTALFML